MLCKHQWVKYSVICIVEKHVEVMSCTDALLFFNGEIKVRYFLYFQFYARRVYNNFQDFTNSLVQTLSIGRDYFCVQKKVIYFKNNV
jgi:hypothetical protein